MEEHLKKAMVDMHENVHEAVHEKVQEVKNNVESLEGVSRANRFVIAGYTVYNVVLLSCSFCIINHLYTSILHLFSHVDIIQHFPTS